jgi:hypothetical protein
MFSSVKLHEKSSFTVLGYTDFPVTFDDLGIRITVPCVTSSSITDSSPPLKEKHPTKAPYPFFLVNEHYPKS